MVISGKPTLLAVLVLTSFVAGLGCSKKSEEKSTVSVTAPAAPEAEAPPPPQKTSDGTLSSGTGVEKEKPAPGTGNVQGKVLYNDLPAENIEVKLCETFNRFMGGCSGETYTALTDASGEYLIKNIPPKTYEGLTAKVFDTSYFVFITSGIISAAKYKIDADKTFFAPTTSLFKADLKVTNPPAGSQIDAANIEVRWDPYPDAAYYKLSIHADSSTGTMTNMDYIGRRVDGVSFLLDKPLASGTYRLRVEAYNAKGTKLADNSDEVKFTVKGAASGAPTETQPN